MSTQRSVARNLSANYLGIAIRSAVLLALTPFVIQRLGASGYAVWILIQTLSFYLRFLDFGLYNALVKYLAGYVAEGRQKEINDLIANVLGSLIIAGAAALALSVFIAEFIVPLFRQVPRELAPAFEAAIILFGVDLLISFPGSVANGIYEGYQRYDLLNFMGSSLLLLQSLGTVVLLLLGYSIVQLAVLEIIISIIAIIANFLIIRRIFPQIRWRLRLFQAAPGPGLRDYRLWSSLNEILVEGSSHLDKLLLPLFLSVALLTPYSIVCTLAAILLAIIQPLSNVLFPMSSAQEAARDRQGQQRALVLSTKAGFAVSLPAAIFLAGMGNFLIDAWIGHEYVKPPAALMPIVVGSFLVTVFFMPATSMLAGMAKLKGIFIFSAVEAVLAVALIILTVPRYELIGLAASCAVANFLIGFGCLLPFACRHLQVPVSTYLREGLMLPLIPGVPAAAAAYFLTESCPPESWLLLTAYAVAITAVYALVFCFASISRADRTYIGYRLRKLLVRPRLGQDGHGK